MDKLAIEINNAIKDSFEYKQYLKAKENLNKNEHLLELKNKIQLIKNEVCKNSNDALIDEYYSLDKKYREHILVKEYEKCKEEVYLLISEISDILSVK